MKVKVQYYVPVEVEIEMTPEEYCHYHADGCFHGEKVVPETAIRAETILDEKAQEELDDYFFSKG